MYIFFRHYGRKRQRRSNMVQRKKNIFVTGGTGFMGKVLVEKLLYSCSDLGTLYILMRPKGKSSEERLKDMWALPVMFHLAAILRLEAQLKDSIEMNTMGTQRTLALAKDMKKIRHLHSFKNNIPCSFKVTPSAYGNRFLVGWTVLMVLGVMAAAGKGVLRTMQCNEDNYAQVIPVDIAINAILVIAWKHGSVKLE
ncbi:male sterility protein 2-related [Holotrichia oblita]|uniref:Male sterility protein 2-related n=1 Tax=Holotrichia oblita TaxID=644536 RepID=A0ACB9TTX3_HOLOL|nr:male sterility protein 2-related [Holotrichia oblita]